MSLQLKDILSSYSRAQTLRREGVGLQLKPPTQIINVVIVQWDILHKKHH